ncbi:MAG: nucleotidyltransferase family protein [Planctomycetota bacterium]|nr:MAG: nucleotidyltransferase family protein [Planctomycetota bacterium]
MDKAVILARGLGKRMRECNSSLNLTQAQVLVAESGFKAMMPFKRPFVDYVINELADAGYCRICLVIGPEHNNIREYYQSLKCRRISIEFAIQEKPLGTADAVVAAEDFVGDDTFIVINADNHYPAEALQALKKLDGPGLIGFERDSLIAGSNIEKERILRFAVIQTDNEGFLTNIIEKPGEKILVSVPKPVCVSMNCWRMNPTIFKACRAISPSVRGELELPDAVLYCIKFLGEKYRTVFIKAAVLDLTSRSDIGPIAGRLANKKISL